MHPSSNRSGDEEEAEERVMMSCIEVGGTPETWAVLEAMPGKVRTEDGPLAFTPGRSPGEGEEEANEMDRKEDTARPHSAFSSSILHPAVNMDPAEGSIRPGFHWARARKSQREKEIASAGEGFLKLGPELKLE